MDLWIIRAILFVAVLVSGYFIRPFGAEVPQALLYSGILGIIIILAEMRIRRLSLKTLLGAAVGSVLGIIGASLISFVITRMHFTDPQTETFLQLIVLVIMLYVGLVAGANKGQYLDLSILDGVLPDSVGRKIVLPMHIWAK